MPVTPEQAQMLTTLALACRPTGARRWDAPGVIANIRKVADRDLATVVIAVIQAAEDRNAETPGVVASAGPHWRAPDPGRATTRWPYDPATFCHICGGKVAGHRLTDHEPISAAEYAARLRPVDVGRAVQGLRELKDGRA